MSPPGGAWRTAFVRWAWERMRRAGEVRAGSGPARRFREFGEGSSIAFPPGSVFGEKWITIGAHTLVGAEVTLSAGWVPHRDLGPDPVVRVGSGCVIGRGSHVVGHMSITIEDHVYMGPYVYITDENHSYENLDEPIGTQWPERAAVLIGEGSWLGTGVIVLPGTTIGRHVVVAAGSVVRGEIPDHCVIAGSPARVVRRYLPQVGWDPPRRGA